MRQPLIRDWRSDAECLDEDPELFFAGKGQDAVTQIAVAKAVCWRCPVTKECLQWALDNKIEFGVWGGLSDSERRSLKRRNSRARAAQAVPA